MDQVPNPQDNSAPPPYDPEKVADALSRDRLSKYLARTGGSVDRALALYTWNGDLAVALTRVLSQVEVCLRNAISRALTDAFPPEVEGRPWHRVVRFRYAHLAVQSELATAEARLKPEPSLPDIVAACDFNLWRELLKPGYAGVFWARRIPLAFPHLSLKGKEREILTELHRRVDLLLKLRNRIAHHEPIIGSNWETLGAKVTDRHREGLDLLDWMNSDLASWVRARDDFMAMLDACPEPRVATSPSKPR